jgi:5-methylcytosine-specific restriction enzyme subunit McrC
MRPDIVIQRDGRPIAVLDLKWKKGTGLTSDVYQVLAYCTALGVRRAVLVYPGRRDRLWKYELAKTPVIVEMRTLRVVGPRAACLHSLDRLGRAVRKATS